MHFMSDYLIGLFALVKHLAVNRIYLSQMCCQLPLAEDAAMLHPGYGFLAENSSFVDICMEHGINFIGPNPVGIRVMGDKATAGETMRKAGVPTVRGSEAPLQTTEEAVELAHEIGFPVMIKGFQNGKVDTAFIPKHERELAGPWKQVLSTPAQRARRHECIKGTKASQPKPDSYAGLDQKCC